MAKFYIMDFPRVLYKVVLEMKPEWKQQQFGPIEGAPLTPNTNEVR